MGYVNYIIICATLLIGFAAFRAIAYQNKKAKRSLAEFWNRESEANSVRRADISNLDYITLSFDKLPINEVKNAGFSDIYDELIRLSEKKFINLSEYTNTDLKMMYGPANLEALSEYDNNYSQLIRLLNKLSKEFIKIDKTDAAKKVLCYSIEIGSDLSTDYEMLGKIYLDSKDTAGFKKLEEKAADINSLSKNLIISKLDNVKAHKSSN
ncbi:MAG: hypothetical protein IJ054_08320 [Lachnospiraceae bacterium]|nr:hypothetical protein [Lachnospiraceae bacterium]MBQ9232734.1 hypothetical protein [Lachnospiraceae bacterium]